MYSFTYTGKPLSEWQIVALTLYTDGDCSYDLCESQRNGDHVKKWPFFHYYLNESIAILSRYETHFENIYTGVCNAKLDISKAGKTGWIAFSTNVSFTSDLNIALQFRGSEGLIFGLNMRRSANAIFGQFRACDISWISSYPKEKEILCYIASPIQVYLKNVYVDKEKNQWIVCDEGNQQETSFENMFLINLTKNG